MLSIVTAYTDHIAELERQLAEAQARYEADKQRGHKYRDKLMSQLAEANGRVAALTTRRSAWNEESEHADKAVNARLLDRLRNDGTSWAQPLFDEAADRIAELERQLDEAREIMARELVKKDGQERILERQLAEARETIQRDNALLAEWSRQNLAIIALEVQQRKRAEEAERSRFSALALRRVVRNLLWR